MDFIGLIFLALFVFLFIYTTKIEPNAIRVTKLKLNTNKPSSPVRMVHFTDSHFIRMTKRDLNAIKIINGLEPDIICFTGDFVEKEKGIEDAGRFFGQLKSRHGTFAVLGNNDNRVGKDKVTERILKSGTRILDNETLEIELNGARVSITGINDTRKKMDNYEKAVRNLKDGGIKIFLCHSPEGFVDLKGKKFDLILTGHTHGGQVCFPPFGPLVKNINKNREYYSGKYFIGDTLIYVSRGVGLSVLPFRFLCPPEIVYIEIT